MTADDSVDDDEIQSALSSIGLSAALIFGATLLSQGLGFLTRITMAGYLPVNGYGNVVIGITILNLFGIAALAGLPDALSRYIPRQESDSEKQAIVSAAFQLVGVLSFLIGALIYLGAEPLASQVFGNKDLVWIIRIFAGVMPFYALFKLSLGGFRGYETTYPRVLTQNVLRPMLQLVGIVLFVSVGFDTVGIAFAYAVAFTLVAVVSLWLLQRVGRVSVRSFIRSASVARYRKLLTFSIPLAMSGAIGVITKQSDLVILAIFKTSDTVAVYEVAYRLSNFVLALFLPAVGYLFQPLVSRFHANGRETKMDQMYTITARWVLIATFPVFALFVLFPEQSLVFFFDARYQRGGTALSILVTGFMLSLVPGLSGAFLTATGKTKTLLYIATATGLLNLGINVLLIPIYGVVGAAIATATATVFNNVVQFYVILRNFDVHPFNRSYVLPSALIVSVLFLVRLAPVRIDEFTFAQGFVFAAGVSLLYLVFVLVTRSVYEVEVALIDELLDLLGVPVSLEPFLSPFTR